jgi:signal transduction histidine kinase
MPDRPRVDWRFAALATLAVTCLFTLQNQGHAGAPPFPVAHRRELVAWGIWLALTPLIVVASRRVVLGAGSGAGWLARQLLLGTGFALASLGLSGVLDPVLGAGVGPAGGLGPRFAGELLRYAIIAMAYQTVASYRAAHERETLAARLRAELAEAKLANLEGRLHPHFLFNTLNSIAALVRVDPRAAETMVEQLSDLLRASLTAHPQREVPLDDELKLVEQYLAIQRTRFQDRLTVRLDASADARRGRVPQLLLQPVVENAVRHGIAPRESGGSVAVAARVERDELVMTVEDDGVGIGNAPPGQAGSGLGLASIEARLRHLYGAAQRCRIEPVAPSGTRVVIAVPFRPAPS